MPFTRAAMSWLQTGISKEIVILSPGINHPKIQYISQLHVPHFGKEIAMTIFVISEI